MLRILQAEAVEGELPGINDRIGDYLPTPEVLEEYKFPHSKDIEARDYVLKNLPGATLALSRRDNNSEKFDMAPTWHPTRAALLDNPGLHYSHLAFEGHMMMPVVDDNGKVIGANLVLHEQRMNRFQRSISSLALNGLVSENTLNNFSRATKDLASMHAHVLADSQGNTILDKNGRPVRGYIRPWAARITGVGVAPKSTDKVAIGEIITQMGAYLPPQAYTDGAVGAAFVDVRRDSEVTGKVAGNYSHAGFAGSRAREVGADEAALFGPYWKDTDGSIKAFDPTNKQIAMEQALKGGLIVDGSGEDLLFFTPGGELLYQPMNTNILGGTTRGYIIDNLAPSLGIRVRECPVGIADIRSGQVVGAAYTGNAAGFCGVREFRIGGPDNQILERLNLEVTPEMKKLTEKFALELSGRVKQTAGPLLTPIDLESGTKAMSKLKKVFMAWF